jgi:hypothetical protein
VAFGTMVRFAVTCVADVNVQLLTVMPMSLTGLIVSEE